MTKKLYALKTHDQLRPEQLQYMMVIGQFITDQFLRMPFGPGEPSVWAFESPVARDRFIEMWGGEAVEWDDYRERWANLLRLN